MGRTWSDEEQRKNIIALRRRFMDEGLDSFMDYQILEMLLEFVSSEKLMNEKAHMLINRFGCLATVLDASIAALKDAGLNEPEIMLLKLLPPGTAATGCPSRNRMSRMDSPTPMIFLWFSIFSNPTSFYEATINN